MSVPLVDVLRAMTTPEVEYAQPNYGAGRLMCQRGDIAVPVVVLNDGTRLALSVLWRTQRTYTRNDTKESTA